jgi:hypothetical protein
LFLKVAGKLGNGAGSLDADRLRGLLGSPAEAP